MDNSRRLLWSVEYVAIVLIGTVLLGLMGCKQESDPLSSEKEITAFSIILGETAAHEGAIDKVSRTIVVSLPAGSDFHRLIPAITLSDHAAVTLVPEGTPALGVARDFNGPQVYEVTAEDGTAQDYEVIVKVDGKSVPITIGLVNDSIVALFGITDAELDRATGIQLYLTGTTRREAVISLTGFDNDGTGTIGANGVRWNVDGNYRPQANGNIFTIKADDYTIGRHWVEVTGTKGVVQYSKTFYFTVDK